MEERSLFKATRLDTHDWILGCLSMHKTGKYFIRPIGGSASSSEEVEKNTICQCTGLKDKNGKLIWENDICKYQWRGKTKIDVIKYVPPMFSYSRTMRWSLDKDEVIGNIFDNKELLESEEK